MVIDRLKDELDKASISYDSIDRNEPASLEEADSIQVNVRGIPLNSTDGFLGTW